MKSDIATLSFHAHLQRTFLKNLGNVNLLQQISRATHYKGAEKQEVDLQKQSVLNNAVL